MSDLATINSQIDEDITNKTQRWSITSTILGVRLKSISTFAQELFDGLNSAKADKTITINGLPISSNITITKALVGLGNVNNTPDNLKPVSIAQAAAISAAQLGVVHLAGGYDASVGTFPASGTGNGGSVRAGDTYRIVTAGIISGINYSINDEIQSLVDNPGQTAANWFRPPYNSSQATEQTVGTSRKATEQESVEGTEQNAYCTPYAVGKAINHALDNFHPPTVSVPLEFSAQLWQSGTNAPNPQASQIDTISNEVYTEEGQQAPGYRAISFSRIDTGIYKLNLWYKTAGGINSSKISVMFGDSAARITGRANGGNGSVYFTQFEFRTYSPAGILSDGVLQGNNGTFINIKIYP